MKLSLDSIGYGGYFTAPGEQASLEEAMKRAAIDPAKDVGGKVVRVWPGSIQSGGGNARQPQGHAAVGGLSEGLQGYRLRRLPVPRAVPADYR